MQVVMHCLFPQYIYTPMVDIGNKVAADITSYLADSITLYIVQNKGIILSANGKRTLSFL